MLVKETMCAAPPEETLNLSQTSSLLLKYQSLNHTCLYAYFPHVLIYFCWLIHGKSRVFWCVTESALLAGLWHALKRDYFTWASVAQQFFVFCVIFVWNRLYKYLVRLKLFQLVIAWASQIKSYQAFFFRKYLDIWVSDRNICLVVLVKVLRKFNICCVFLGIIGNFFFVNKWNLNWIEQKIWELFAYLLFDLPYGRASARSLIFNWWRTKNIYILYVLFDKTFLLFRNLKW